MLTTGTPGVGGRIRVELADFEVDEVPAYPAAGQGDHLFLRVEKRGVGPEHLTRVIADRLGTHPGEVGTAGLKDRYAVTRQWVSVPATCEPRLGQLSGGDITVLDVTRHTNKLRPGHLRGNRFRILIRGADRTQPDALHDVLARIDRDGLPNYYGPQRFGRDGSTADLGFQCLRREQPKRLRPFVYKFALSAAQSVVFNEVLAHRVGDGLFRTVLPGDVLMKWPAGGLFVSDDVATDQPRFDAREVVTGGPMVGGRLFAAAGEAAARETEALAALGLSAELFAGFGKLLGGTRRHNQVYPESLAADWERDGLRLAFTLPSGCYATVLLREVMKPAEDLDAGDADE